MYNNIKPLHNKLHASTKVKTGINIEFMKTQHIVPLVTEEFTQAAIEFPIVFVKNAQTGRFQAVAMMGLGPGQNLFIDNNRWRAVYTPKSMARHPFGLVAHATFENGQETQYLRERKDALISYWEFTHSTESFIKLMDDKELLVAQSLTVQVNGQTKDINGLYLIDEQRFNLLPEAEFADLRKRGLLDLIYAHLISIHQVQRLAIKAAELNFEL